MPMSMSLEDYLECIYMLILAKKPARVRDIAAALGVKTPSVVNGVNGLLRQGFVTHEPYASVELTPAGLKKAVEILDRHELLTTFLGSLGVDPDTAESDACRMEHILSEPTLGAIRTYLSKHKIAIRPATKARAQKKLPAPGGFSAR